jgi:DNA-directed RNA polymerase specialized sigma24 family protein
MAGAMADDAGGRDGRDDLAAARPGRGDAAVVLTSLFRDHHLELVRLALVMVGDQATAEDVVQDAFERLHRGWHDRGELAAALRSLPRRQREVLVLRYYLDLDVAEIAGTLRISPSAVCATNTRGLAALAKALGEE